MSVLFLMPDWNSPSQLWMQRMISQIAEDITFVAAKGTPSSHWRSDVATLPLFKATPALQQFATHRPDLHLESVLEKAALQTIRQAVSSEKVDTVFAQFLPFALRFRTVWADTNKPIVVHCHGYDVTWNFHAHDDSTPQFPPDYIPSVRWLSERALLVVKSQFAATRLESIGIPARSIVIKSHGVPIPSAPIDRRDRGNGVTILYLGRLVDFKGPDLVIRAFEIACERGLQGRLIVAGHGALRGMCELLRARSRFADRIELLGAVGETVGDRLRRQADIFTAHNCEGPVSHQQEAQGVAILEAMASSLPVVAGRSGAVPEFVVAGNTGFLIDPGDIESHAEAFLHLAADPELRHRMGQAGWLRAGENFSVEREKAELRQLLRLA